MRIFAQKFFFHTWSKVLKSEPSKKTSAIKKLQSRPYPLKFLKGCLPQNLLSPLLNTLSHLL